MKYFFKKFSTFSTFIFKILFTTKSCKYIMVYDYMFIFRSYSYYQNIRDYKKKLFFYFFNIFSLNFQPTNLMFQYKCVNLKNVIFFP